MLTPPPSEFVAVLDRADYLALARRRWWLAVLSTPALVSFSVGVAVFDPRMTLLAVVALFAAYALISVSRRSRNAARRTQVSVADGELTLGGLGRGRPLAVIVRRDYVRVLFKEGWVHRLWLDSRRDPDAFIDLPLPSARGAAFADILATAGVPVTRESIAGRVAKLLCTGALGVAGLVLLKVALGLGSLTLGAWLATLGAPEVALAGFFVAAVFVAARRG